MASLDAPDYVTFDGDDPRAFIVSENINRRHMDKGQKAMALAMMFPEGRKRGRGNIKSPVQQANLSKDWQTKDRTVNRVAPLLAAKVLAGTQTLMAAYEEAKAIEQANEPSICSEQSIRSAHMRLLLMPREKYLCLTTRDLSILGSSARFRGTPCGYIPL